MIDKIKLGKKELAGYITVDAGLVQLGDPCYEVNSMEEIEFDDEGDGIYEVGEGKAITVQTGYGDGVFPVYVRRDQRGAILELTVDLNPFKS